MDLVQNIKNGGDLKNEFIIFNHVKQIPYWSTLEVHVYNPIHCKVMTIYWCDMKLEMTMHQKQI